LWASERSVQTIFTMIAVIWRNGTGGDADDRG